MSKLKATWPCILTVIIVLGIMIGGILSGCSTTEGSYGEDIRWVVTHHLPEGDVKYYPKTLSWGDAVNMGLDNGKRVILYGNITVEKR